MKFKILFVLLATLTVKLVAQNADTIVKLPPLNVARIKNIDTKHIAIDLKFDWKKKQAFGSVSITFSPVNKTNKITLDAGMLSINSIVTVGGIPLKFNYDGGDKNDGLEILLDREYNTVEIATIKINYHTNYINESDPNNLWGSFGKGIRFFEPTFTEPNKLKQAWSVADLENNQYWFPCFDAPGDLHTTEFFATVDKKLTVISNGNLISVKNNNDGTKSFHYKADRPYPNNLVSFVVGEYIDVSQKYGDIILHNYAYPEEKEAVAASVVRLPDMVKYFSEVTGLKYPYQTYSQAFVQDYAGSTSNNSGWQGNNTMSTITENMVDDKRTHDDFFYLWDLTEAESLAAQWFGNYIPYSDWSHAWLSKSFAHYFNCLYTEYKNGKDEFLLYQLTYDQGAYLFDWNGGTRHPVVTQNFDNPSVIAGDNYASTRGALVLHMLRKHLGEEIWWKAIKLYVKDNGNKLVSTKDFIAAVNTVSQEKMDWFFDQWIYKMGHPVFEVTKSFDASKKQLTINVRQTQKKDANNEYPQTEFFKGKLDIEIDDEIIQVELESKFENVYSFPALSEPKLVNVDFESTWIKEIKFEKTFEELLYQFQNDKDILGRNSAMIELVAIAKKESTSAENKEKIYSAFRNVISGNTYWRLRFVALPQFRNLLVSNAGKNPFKVDNETREMLLSIIKTETSWIRASAITFLGMTKDVQFDSIYLNALKDSSDRVINSAAIALGKCKSPKAFDALSKLVNKPSWKNQSLISALNGLKELADINGFDIAYKALSDRNLKHWTLATPIWDYRIAAAQTIVSFGKGADAYTMIMDRFIKSMEENDVNDIFSNVLLITTLADSRGLEIFDSLKRKFKGDANAMNAIGQYETQLKESLKK